MPDTLKLLEKAFTPTTLTPTKIPLVFHCYSGGLEYLSAMKELDAYLSLGGPITWLKTVRGREDDALRQVAALVNEIPEDRLLCETDSPWLTPKPYRGKLNEPAYVRFVYEAIARLKKFSVSPVSLEQAMDLQQELERLARLVDENAARLFGWGLLHGSHVRV
jgi:TatD DNase family protein